MHLNGTRRSAQAVTNAASSPADGNSSARSPPVRSLAPRPAAPEVPQRRSPAGHPGQLDVEPDLGRHLRHRPCRPGLQVLVRRDGHLHHTEVEALVRPHGGDRPRHGVEPGVDDEPDRDPGVRRQLRPQLGDPAGRAEERADERGERLGGRRRWAGTAVAIGALPGGKRAASSTRRWNRRGTSPTGLVGYPGVR